MIEKIHIIHTNDLHSHFENFPRIERFVKNQRQQDAQNDTQTLVFDIGDASDRVNPLTEATMAEANVQWMNKIHYDGATIGNSEGLYYGHKELENMYNDANFDVILDNLYETNGDLAHFAQKQKIITTDEGTKIGIIGLTAPYKLTYPLMDWDIRFMADVLPDLIKEIRPKVDILIMLSHLGISKDRYMAEHYPEIDIIMGGHTHHLLIKGEKDNHTLLTAAEKFGHYIGNIELEIQDHKIKSEKAEAIKTDTLPELPSDQAEIAKYNEKGHALLKAQKIADLPFALSKEVKAPHTAMNEMFAAMESVTGAPVAMLSSGLFLKDLHAGVLTEDDLHDQLPHAIHLMKTTLKGREFWRLIMEAEKNRGFLRNFHQKGMGFRGKIFGKIIYDGIEIVPGTRRVLYRGKDLDPNQNYEIALLDHYLFIPYFPTLQIMGDNKLYYPDFLRTVLGKYLAKKYPLKRSR